MQVKVPPLARVPCQTLQRFPEIFRTKSQPPLNISGTPKVNNKAKIKDAYEQHLRL
jgi:hypothetical protein